jgi:hypothetical protein
MEVAVHYRCYFLNLHAKIAGVEVIVAVGDADAWAQADALFREKRAGFSAVEVWDRGRRVERPADDGVDQIRRWRLKAEEIRTAADAFADASARDTMRNSAETYEALANSFEARLKREKDTESDAG